MEYICNLLDYLDNTYRRVPDKIAFADSQESVTFAALYRRTYAVASALREVGCTPNQPVAVLVERSVASVCAMLGVLRCGCYYAPIEAGTPAPRLQKMLRQLAPSAILCTGKMNTEDRFDMDCPVLSCHACFAAPADSACAFRSMDSDPAYVMFTSGSTGEPKGIVISHRSVIDFTEWLAETCEYGPEERFGNQAPFFFDASVKDLYQTLKHGASCYILDKKLFSFPLLLCRALEEQQVTALNWSTSAFALVATSGALEMCAPSRIRIITVGGEVLQAKHVMIWKKHLPTAEIINTYGPTEICVDCAYHRIERNYDLEEPIPIGKACANKEVFLLTEDGRIPAIDEVGEICVAGSGLALGYFGEWEKSTAVFTQDPREPRYRRLIYHTGDLAVRGKDGLLYFRCRKDGQIKHQGYRIELGEIEIALSAITELDAAVCMFDEPADRIVCFYVGAMDGRALAKALRAKLPKYMVPNIYRQLPALPVTANGKTDRVRLMEAYRNEAHTKRG